MIGMFGSGISKGDVSIIKQLIYVDSLRGHHSTGLATVDFQGNIETFKKAVDGPDFLQLNRAGDMLDNAPFCAVIFAHNRFATKGGISTKTAHPFTHGDITLCHNGTLDTQYGLPDSIKFAVDSENIAHAFNVKEPKDIIPILEGAFALTWWDAKTNKFNIVRNDERPLCFATHKTRKVTYYASERRMLEMVLERNNVSDVDYIELAAGKWVSVSVENGAVGLPNVKNIEVMDSFDYYKSYSWWKGGKGSKAAGKGAGKGNGVTTLPSPLEQWGMAVGDEVEFYSSGVAPYASHPSANSSDMGVLSGFMTDEVGLEVKSYNQPLDSLAGFYTGIVTNGVIVGVNKHISVNKVKLKEVIEGDANNVGLEKELEALSVKKKQA
jgi:hypothetical protein